jgi:hypothetical protein
MNRKARLPNSVPDRPPSADTRLQATPGAVVRVPQAALRDLVAGPPVGTEVASDAAQARPCASEHPERPGCGGSAR